MKSLLAYLLIASLLLNAYLIWQTQNQEAQSPSNIGDTERAKTSQASSTLATNDLLKSSSDELVTNESQASRSLISLSEQHSDAQKSVQDANSQQAINLAFLRELQKAKRYELLRYYVQQYLRAYPRDGDALLLEAEAYYYTQPLNTALVNYYGLLDAPLSDVQIEEIKKLIDVNTTRIVQQFSGDGSWELLATFLEPLLQVDPLNRRYIIALAKAYGMQEQTVLMENVLASLMPNDTRAQRLRDEIYRRSKSEQTSEKLADNKLEDDWPQTARDEVYLTKRRGQYYAQATFGKEDALLLVDTGASITALSQQVFNRIPSSDTQYLGTFNVQTAGGMVSRSMYKIKEIKLSKQRFNNVSVMILPTQDMRDFDGLLGMNIIGNFVVAYDGATDNMRMYK